MKRKKILIGLAVVIVMFVAFEGYQIATTKSHSPLEKKETNISGCNIKVLYCQTFKKGRFIFGEQEEGALIPYGKYWRLGANEATEISFSKDVLFAERPLKAGTYRMYAVPDREVWEISLNSELGQWGDSEPDYSKDILKVEVPANNDAPEIEKFSINFSGDSTKGFMDFAWDKTLVKIPIETR